ncbi:Clp protease [Streptosporangium violaceochromogenes]|nr:Clp protease [Streptosporangium violaceochromogenes]
MFERFQSGARQAVVGAQENARRLNHTHVGTEHLLLGLLGRPENLSTRVLGRYGVDHGRVYRAVAEATAGRRGDDLDAGALETIGIDLSAIREKVEAAFGPGALDRAPRPREGRLFGGRHIPLTRRAKKVLELSLREAVHMRHGSIGDGHMLLGILREREGLAARVLTGANVDLALLRQDVVRELG